jgi:hypothetical protein
MNDEAGIRRANLQALCKRRDWGPAELHTAMDYGTYSYWHDLLELTTKSFGEKVARRIEEKLELGRGYLDEPNTPGTHRYPRAEQVLPPPAVPPPDFHDRRVVSVSDWALLQDVKTAATQEELEAIRARAARMQAKVEELLAERIAASTGPAPSPPPKPRKVR